MGSFSRGSCLDPPLVVFSRGCLGFALEWLIVLPPAAWGPCTHCLRIGLQRLVSVDCSECSGAGHEPRALGRARNGRLFREKIQPRRADLRRGPLLQEQPAVQARGNFVRCVAGLLARIAHAVAIVIRASTYPDHKFGAPFHLAMGSFSRGSCLDPPLVVFSRGCLGFALEWLIVLPPAAWGPCTHCLRIGLQRLVSVDCSECSGRQRLA